MAEFGVLCHVTCLNNPYGLGDFGKCAYEFVDFLSEIGATVWEVLPLNLANDFNCPYGAMSVFSFDEMFVDLEELCEIGLLKRKQLKLLKKFKNSEKVNFSIVKPEKLRLFECAYNNLKSKSFLQDWVKTQPHIFEYAYWRTLLDVFGVKDWRLVDRKFWKKNSKAGKCFVEENKEVFQKYIFFQFVLQKQWENLKVYANKKGIKIFGDLPAYCDKASVEVFSHPEYVRLDKDMMPAFTGGTPADSIVGEIQDWGTCVYDWQKLKEEKYSYLIERMEYLLKQFDILRLDHFVAYIEYFEIPKSGKSKPKFVKGGGKEFFEELGKKIDLSRIVVEDIGTVNKSCLDVKKKFNLAGMSVLQFAFDTDESNPNLPRNVKENSIFYTQTHDYNTFMGFLKSLENSDLQRVSSLLNCQKTGLMEIQISAIKKLLNSKAKIAMIPVQDLMFLDERFRMNIAGVAENCWEYRLQKNFKKLIKNNVKRYF